jgi:uncharacterized protein YbaR (Trm112 family)
MYCPECKNPMRLLQGVTSAVETNKSEWHCEICKIIFTIEIRDEKVTENGVMFDSENIP